MTILPEPRVSFPLPSNVPHPKFTLFQRVQYRACPEQLHPLTVVGMEYVDPITALVNDTASGWLYAVNNLFGLTPEQALDARDRHSTTQYVYGCKLEAVEG